VLIFQLYNVIQYENLFLNDILSLGGTDMTLLQGIGEGTIIREWVRFSRPGNILIGNKVMIDDFVLLSGGREEITVIEDHVHIACFTSCLGSAAFTFEYGSNASPGCRLFSSSDDYVHGGLINPTFPDKFRNETAGRITLGRFSCLGANCIVLPGVKIGEGATIGAASLVNKDIEPWTVNVGVPAKPIKTRNKKELLRRFSDFLKEIP
jgi:dTDP-4-amino-4,6-dideoxy-D-glucose acyltransferase